MPFFEALMGFSLLFGKPPIPAGNAIVARSATTVAPSYMVTLTAYNAVPAQTDASPFETASGAPSNPQIVAARSADLAGKLPFGTIIELDGSSISSGDTCGYGIVAPLIGYRIIADTMNSRYHNRIDVLFDTKAEYARAAGKPLNAATILGVCKGVTVRVVGHIDIANLKSLPTTQRELAMLLGRNSTLALR